MATSPLNVLNDPSRVAHWKLMSEHTLIACLYALGVLEGGSQQFAEARVHIERELASRRAKRSGGESDKDTNGEAHERRTQTEEEA